MEDDKSVRANVAHVLAQLYVRIRMPSAMFHSNLCFTSPPMDSSGKHQRTRSHCLRLDFQVIPSSSPGNPARR